MSSGQVIIIAGPTGTGKSALALRLARAIGGEIINYDSVQVYRGFDLGSAKPPAAERAFVPHHLFDIAEATDEINAAGYGRRAREICRDVVGRGRHAIFAGGTFFYLRAFLSGLPEMPPRDEGLRGRIRAIAARKGGPGRLHRWLSNVDPQSGRTIAAADRHRVERALEVWITSGRPISEWGRPQDELAAIKIGLTLERPVLVELLDRRVEAMYAAGLVEETRLLLERYPETARPFGTIGYREAVGVIRGRMSEREAIAETKRRTRAYAKRQMTWLRSEQNVQWVDARPPEKAFESAMRIIEGAK